MRDGGECNGESAVMSGGGGVCMDSGGVSESKNVRELFDGIVNVIPSEEKVSTTGVTLGNLELLLRSNSPDSHQTEIQEDEILD